jgi:hypothetical protein
MPNKENKFNPKSTLFKMPTQKGFIAFPNEPHIIQETIILAKEKFDKENLDWELNTWIGTSKPGAFVGSNVREEINESNFLIADISVPNFNVIYEIGYAIGKSKKLILILNQGLKEAGNYLDDIGIIDTITYENYENSDDLSKIFKNAPNKPSIFGGALYVNYQQPNFILECYRRFEFYNRVVASIKQAGLYFRSYDPKEQPRLAPTEAIKQISSSVGVIIPLIQNDYFDSENHNFRAAFLSGLAHGMGKEVLLLQYRDGPIPIDYRDYVTQVNSLEKIFPVVEAFAKKVFVALQTKTPHFHSSSDNFLASLNIGSSAAENEYRDLGEYYIETHEFKRALRGEGRIVAGRKGSGKSAIFWQIRDRVRSMPHNLVLDLKPDGYQLKKFKEQVLQLLDEGTKEHTITAFWEYLLYLEICNQIFENDKKVVGRNPNLTDKFLELENLYKSDDFIQEGDFSERLGKLLSQIQDKFESKLKGKSSLDREELTEILYSHDVNQLKSKLTAYLIEKETIVILIDNLDKGWPAQGLEDADVLLIKSLLEATRKIERDFKRSHSECNSIVFIRNDVYELLVETTSDRGKEAVIKIDWTDVNLFKQLIRQRLIFGGADADQNIENIWSDICIENIEGDNSLDFLIQRSLMRPRCLIELIQHCVSHAVNLDRSKISEEDILAGLHAYSIGLSKELSKEIRDVYPKAENVLYVFFASKNYLTREDCLLKILDIHDIDEEEGASIIGFLLWFGFLGVKVDETIDKYIYDCAYDMQLLNGMINQVPKDNEVFCINPAFWSGLETK